MGRSRHISTQRRLSLVLVGFFLVAAAALLLIRDSYYRALPGLTETLVYEVAAGSSLSQIANELKELRLFENPQLFKLAARFTGVAGAIKAGEYRLEPGLSPADLLQLLVSGETIQYRVTLVEGWTLQQVLEELASHETIAATLAPRSSSDLEKLAENLELETENPEGLIHPDTYFFTRGTRDIDILRRARNRQQEILDAAWENRLGALPYTSPYEALVLASIIEKESGIDTEKGHIAGIFVRRLQRNMRLQSDPTVIYGLGEEYAGNLTRNHLQTTTAYNTYRVNGLPPTPISIPGEESIRASLQPLESDYLYFVATGEGGHYFSATLEEHNAAVDRYQRQTGNNQ